MPLCDICFVCFDPTLDECRGAAAAYAVDLAARHSAHLTLVVGVAQTSIASLSPVFDLAGIEAEANARSRERAETFGERLRELAAVAGVSASVEIRQGALFPVYEAVARVARVHDLAVVDAPRPGFDMHREFVEDLIESSGAPVVLVPQGWTAGARIRRALLAWDGGREAARAMHQAAPILDGCGSIDVVRISGESSRARRAAAETVGGADAARHLARHCAEVSVSDRPARDGRVFDTLQLHAGLTGADLIVMGFYGHSRLRESILGGATRDALSSCAMPVLLAA